MIDILDAISRVTTVVFLLTILWAIYLWFKGILPAMLRLGNGLAKRKIAIFAKGDNFDSLKDLLIDSKLFNQRNIARISSQGDLKKAEQQTLFLVYWSDWESDLDKIVKLKKDGTALVVYAPQEKGFIPKEQMTLLNNERNVMVTNFRGRLLNDIVVSMITTGYEQ
jgi:hypothetical protein